MDIILLFILYFVNRHHFHKLVIHLQKHILLCCSKELRLRTLLNHFLIELIDTPSTGQNIRSIRWSFY